ncbi:glycoside hydrolase family 19 protein [Oricola thermophila]|uniref:Carboxypeptidase n=1 Tax=Oricola thermophila TaxID=2742145 RepID=A0A6N1VA94_9HYPH|nr:glycoside hydrolase family 19 protein [Oricola thermophila]QKV17866.1 carboxypeptidase [Oricola thermophila]
MDLDKGHTRLIIRTAEKHGLLRTQLAYVLATAWHETAHTMKPVREAYWLSESWRKKNLRYYPWYGRGFVQLTWKFNYEKASRELGRDFLSDPDAVMEPEASAEILVVGSKDGWFTGKKLSDYITLSKSDYRNARRIINGMDKAADIAKLAKEYEADLKAIGYGEKKAAGAQKPVPAPTHQNNTETAPRANSGGILARLIEAILDIIARARK